eukprot:TRINITY_DN38123_c0_g1_i1.p1 TRINITY_DN38123_c0_g1~~TRINITY_DN38123_c0_g1_i1.p1  ORF type:complete len:311 (+),score=12.66 TRINITY_DN38123_c0_g1_i1:61-933(+)
MVCLLRFTVCFLAPFLPVSNAARVQVDFRERSVDAIFSSAQKSKQAHYQRTGVCGPFHQAPATRWPLLRRSDSIVRFVHNFFRAFRDGNDTEHFFNNYVTKWKVQHILKYQNLTHRNNILLSATEWLEYIPLVPERINMFSHLVVVASVSFSSCPVLAMFEVRDNFIVDACSKFITDPTNLAAFEDGCPADDTFFWHIDDPNMTVTPCEDNACPNDVDDLWATPLVGRVVFRSSEYATQESRPYCYDLKELAKWVKRKPWDPFTKKALSISTLESAVRHGDSSIVCRLRR